MDIRGRSEWVEIAVGPTRIIVHTEHPVAVVRAAGGKEVVVAWPDLDAGLRAISGTVLGAPTGAWVFYRPHESEDESLPAGHSSAVHIGTDGTVTTFVRLAHRHVLGVTRHGLWLTSDSWPDTDEDPAWHRSHVTVIGPDGSTENAALGRRVASVIDDGGSTTIVQHDGPPTTTPQRFGGKSYAYNYVSTSFAGASLPLDRLDDLEATPFDEQQFLTAMESLRPTEPERPPRDPGIRWDLVDLTPHMKNAAIDSVRREFDSLDHYWRDQDDNSFPLSRGLSDPRIERIGEWPSTRVAISFTHPSYPNGRLRRTLRVFDDAGRVIPALYASVHLMEDLDTKLPPDAGAARDGVLDI